ncbi:nucleotidyltransferase family protein [uncultured Winogradskyella sp.]|uniref:nucleotidyltransferase family protein n=1 Tax=uncultured Winogradskyella sp. TaxID=395353 RepID=UPI0030DBACE3|tara:strand:- start:137600 stop:138637 length:1038 start_codon:yes stop_codon:yes gene_type:complete
MSNQYIIPSTATIKEALVKLDLSLGKALFIVNDSMKVLASISDGDIRRALIKGHSITELALDVAHKNFKFIQQNTTKKEELEQFKANKITLIPILNAHMELVKIIDISKIKVMLPLDAVIMAGGKGSRLMPLTEHTPKPLLKVGDKAIIKHNTDRLASYGIRNINITLNYLGEQIVSFYEKNNEHQIKFNYVTEDKPLGTIGALKLIKEFENDYILLMNSDLLTNADFEDIFNNFLLKEGDALIATIPYKVNIPYGVVETKEGYVTDLKEKPSYTYYSNAGIYIFKKECLDFVPDNAFFNATDLIDVLIKKGKKIINYPILSYWLDIGKHEDFEKAQEDIKHIRL